MEIVPDLTSGIRTGQGSVPIASLIIDRPPERSEAWLTDDRQRA